MAKAPVWPGKARSEGVPEAAAEEREDSLYMIELGQVAQVAVSLLPEAYLVQVLAAVRGQPRELAVPAALAVSLAVVQVVVQAVVQAATGGWLRVLFLPDAQYVQDGQQRFPQSPS